MNSGASVFVVEDEALIAMELCDRLSALSYTVCGSAARGEEALDEIRACGPDVVLMDIHLAGKLNGIDTVAQLRQRSDVPVVFLTAYSDEALLQQAGQVGAIGYLVKPFQERELHATLQTALFKHRMERQLRQALATLDATEDAAFIFEPETLRFAYVNQGAVRQLGYTREVLLAMSPVEIMPEFDEPRLRGLLRSILEVPGRAERFSTWHRHQDGRAIPVEINLQYVAPVGGHPRFIAIARDITERQALERLARRTQRLEAISTLASGVAHELNNALTPILLGLASVRKRYPQEAGILDLVEASAERCASTVRQILAFAHGETGGRAPIRPDALLQELERRVRDRLPRNILIVVRADPVLPPLSGDEEQLLLVLQNLTANACDAMPQGGTLTVEAARIELTPALASLWPEAKPGCYVALRVHDTGIGIAPEILDRIFDPFFTTKDLERGTGLGLSTALGIVRGHDGFLQVNSRPGQGAAFTIYLPIWAPPSAAPPSTPPR